MRQGDAQAEELLLALERLAAFEGTDTCLSTLQLMQLILELLRSCT